MVEKPDAILGEDHIDILSSADRSSISDIEGEHKWNLAETADDLHICDEAKKLQIWGLPWPQRAGYGAWPGHIVTGHGFPSTAAVDRRGRGCSPGATQRLRGE